MARGIKITEFERRQLMAIRDEIDNAFVDPNAVTKFTTVIASLIR